MVAGTAHWWHLSIQSRCGNSERLKRRSFGDTSGLAVTLSRYGPASSAQLVQADWYDPSNDSYNPKLHRKFQLRGARVLAWDLDFDRDMERMVGARLEAIVTDSLEEMLDRRRNIAGRLT